MSDEKIKTFYESLPVYVMDTAYEIFFSFQKEKKTTYNQECHSLESHNATTQGARGIDFHKT